MTMMMIPNKTPDLIWRSLDDGTVIINPEQGDVRVLNEVGARVWELVDGQRSADQIAQEITQDFEVSLEDAERDLQKYLDTMIEQGLLRWQESND